MTSFRIRYVAKIGDNGKKSHASCLVSKSLLRHWTYEGDVERQLWSQLKVGQIPDTGCQSWTITYQRCIYLIEGIFARAAE